MGNKKVQAHGLHFFLVPMPLTEGIFDAHLLFNQSAEFDWAKVDVPYPVVNLFEAHILAGATDADIDPVAAPTDAALAQRNESRVEQGVPEHGEHERHANSARPGPA